MPGRRGGAATGPAGRTLLASLLLTRVVLALGAAGAAGEGDRGPIRAESVEVRLFCAACFDRYAHGFRPRTVGWQGDPRVWRTGAGALTVSRDGGAGTMLEIDGTPYDPATVYLLVDGRWRNLAVLLDPDTERVMDPLEPYIPVQTPPPRE